MILKNYLLRTVKDPLNFGMLIVFPIVMITIFITTSRADIPAELRLIGGYCTVATNMLFFNALFFQYFCGLIVTDFLYLDFRSDMRWRLMASPQPFRKFIFSAIIASIIVSMVNGAIVLTFGRFVFDAYINVPMMVTVLLGMGIFTTLLGVLFFLIFPKKGTTTAAVMIFAFAQMLALNFNMISIPGVGEVGVAFLLPLVAAVRVLEYTGGMVIQFNDPDLGWLGGFTRLDTDFSMALVPLGFLAGLVVAVLIAVIIVGRKRRI